jgi:holliday junction DNA helicase RuvA
MIARLRGRISGRSGSGLVVEVNGVGYLVHATPSVRKLGDGEVTVEIHTVVREDALQLFGFATSEERELFELLLGVSGVGPKAALAIVSGYAPDQIRRAISTGDHALFTSISGIGKKTAERVVLDLKDKVAAPAVVAAAEATAPGGGAHTAARDALVGLGMSVAEAESALTAVDEDLPVEERIRLALTGSL